jgi:putative effector of murein hydrolase LrgA (UPF0299 family)
VKASVALFLAAEVAIVAAVGEDGLWLVVAWAVVSGVVVGVGYLVRHHAAARLVLAAALVAGCVLFAVELGLFFVPAAVALLAAAAAELHRTSRHHRRPHGGAPLHAGR